MPYHSRHHVAEAVRSIALLGAQACCDGSLTPALAGLGVIAMVGHDWGHDGTPGGDGRLEAIAAACVAPFLASLAPPDAAVIRTVILGTNPSLVARNAMRAAAANGPNADRLCQIANEADVLASLLPALGWQQARALAREWRGTPPAGEVASFTGRLRLLRAYDHFSPAATTAGLAAICHRQIAAFAAATGLAADAAAAALDAMPCVQAHDVYGAALATA